MTNILPSERIERSIFLIRGHKVMLDADLAVLYGVSVGRLNEAVKRNRDRFPDDFMFQLSPAEFHNLKLPNRRPKLEIANCDIKFRLGWPAPLTVCFYGTRSSHAFRRVEEQTSGKGQY